MKFFAEIRKKKKQRQTTHTHTGELKMVLCFRDFRETGPRSFSEYSGFPLFTKTNISKLQFDWNAQAFLNDFLGLRGLTNQTFTYILKT